jgi:hypothetical protein
MAVTVTGDLMPGISNHFHNRGTTLGYPAKDKEGRFDINRPEQCKNFPNILFYP